MRTRGVRFVSVSAVLAASLVVARPSPARADGDVQASAAASFAEGQRAFNAGDYRRAAESFEAAYRDKPHYSPLWNAARSWERAGEAPRAANLYARYLIEAPPDAPDRDGATTALSNLAQRLARLELHPAPGVSVEVDGEAVTSRTFYVNPGDHIVVGKKGDQRSRKLQTVQSGDVVSVAVDVDAPAAPPPAPRAAAAAAAAATPPPSHDDGSAHAHHGLTPIVAITGGVLTLAAGGFTIWSGLDTLSQKDTFDQSRTQQNLDDGRSKQTRTNIGLVATSVFAVATGVTAIFFTDWGGHDKERAGTGTRVGVGPGSFLLQGSF